MLVWSIWTWSFHPVSSSLRDQSFLWFTGRKNNFKVKNGNTMHLPYDLGSIMHYGRWVLAPSLAPKNLFDVLQTSVFICSTQLLLQRRWEPDDAGEDARSSDGSEDTPQPDRCAETEAALPLWWGCSAAPSSTKGNGSHVCLTYISFYSRWTDEGALIQLYPILMSGLIK